MYISGVSFEVQIMKTQHIASSDTGNLACLDMQRNPMLNIYELYAENLSS